jgi:hypothetical protein
MMASGSASGNLESGYRLSAEPDRFSVEFDVWSDAAPNYQQPERHTWVKQGERFVRK